MLEVAWTVYTNMANDSKYKMTVIERTLFRFFFVDNES